MNKKNKKGSNPRRGAMEVYNNVSAIRVVRYMENFSRSVDKSIERISSGRRLNRAGDNASDFAVSQRMQTQIRGLEVAEKNALMGLSFLENIESSLSEVNDILQRIRVLALQSANGIYSANDRRIMQMEVSELVDEVNRISSQAEFNQLKLLNGNLKEIFFQIGPNQGQRMKAYLFTMNAKALGLIGKTGRKVSVETPEKANQTIGIVDEAINKINSQRAILGAYYNRMDYTVKSLMERYESMVSAESRIGDTDIAREVVNLTKNQILLQSSVAMLAQANFKPHLVLQILG